MDGDVTLTELTDGKPDQSSHTPMTLNARAALPEHTMTEAWRVVSWPPVLWQADAMARLELVHLGTAVLNHGDTEMPCSGHTVWGTRGPDGPAGMAWDWIQIPQGVLALADPLAVVTNLWLLDPAGQVLSPLQAVPRLSQVVHNLPWQLEVQRVIASQLPH